MSKLVEGFKKAAIKLTQTGAERATSIVEQANQKTDDKLKAALKGLSEADLLEAVQKSISGSMLKEQSSLAGFTVSASTRGIDDAQKLTRQQNLVNSLLDNSQQHQNLLGNATRVLETRYAENEPPKAVKEYIKHLKTLKEAATSRYDTYSHLAESLSKRSEPMTTKAIIVSTRSLQSELDASAKASYQIHAFKSYVQNLQETERSSSFASKIINTLKKAPKKAQTWITKFSAKNKARQTDTTVER